jgi:Rrf2 family nitric oxide-sensitive transcriptional repressor
MRLTLHTDYALRTLIYLATVDDEWPSVRAVAEAHRISRDHLGKVTQALSRHGYVETRSGRSGGMRLAMAPTEIVVGEVVRALEPGLAPVVCLERTADQSCVITAGCGLIAPMREAVDAFLEVLDGYTLADCIQRKDVIRGALLRSAEGEALA